jgi:D-alanyl-D-alanine carboxypeptidase
VKRGRACKKAVAAVGVMAVAVLSAGQVAHADDRSRLQRDLDAVREHGVTGAWAEVTSGHVTRFARSGVADLETGRPVPRNAYYRIGSTTKTFVAVVVLQLVAEGRLSLEDPVEKWLPGVVEGNGNDGRKITVRHLLRQNSGLHDYVLHMPMYAAAIAEGYPGFLRERFRTHRPEEMVAMAMRHRPNWTPSGPDEQRWSYSNTNYILAGMIVHKITGRTWDQEVRARITGPLGLRHTAVPPDPRRFPKPHATAYMQFPNDDELRDVTLNADMYADGGLVGKADEVGRFFRALMRGRLLPPAQLDEMMKTVPRREPGSEEESQTRYGLGLEWNPLSCGGGYWFHNGDSLGIANRLGVTPNGKRSVVVALSTETLDESRELAKDAAAAQLIDRALCEAPMG